jgi:hypothetical protein
MKARMPFQMTSKDVSSLFAADDYRLMRKKRNDHFEISVFKIDIIQKLLGGFELFQSCKTNTAVRMPIYTNKLEIY